MLFKILNNNENESESEIKFSECSFEEVNSILLICKYFIPVFSFEIEESNCLHYLLNENIKLLVLTSDSYVNILLDYYKNKKYEFLFKLEKNNKRKIKVNDLKPINNKLFIVYKDEIYKKVSNKNNFTIFNEGIDNDYELKAKLNITFNNKYNDICKISCIRKDEEYFYFNIKSFGHLKIKNILKIAFDLYNDNDIYFRINMAIRKKFDINFDAELMKNRSKNFLIKFDNF